jgi:hypothetical protein
VALWLFPRAEKGDSRYRPERVEAAYWLLTAARLLAEASRPWMDAGWQPWAVVGGGAGQMAELAIYFWTMWPRIRAVGSHLREAKGERF